MVKAVIGEETRLKSAEERLSHSAVPSQVSLSLYLYIYICVCVCVYICMNFELRDWKQVGLVIGKLSASSDRCLVFDLVPTPPNDAGEPACSLIEADKKKGSKGKSQSDSSSSSSLFIDKDWVAEHARQVSRMLLGGVKVLGIYVWMSESSFKNSTLILCQVLFRWTCRNSSLASNISSSSLRPCDFKMGRVLASLQTFRCTYTFDLRLPICHQSASNVRKLADILRQAISSHGKELKEAKAMIDGNLVVEEESCVSDGLHEVEFLVPFMEDSYVEACSQKEVVGVLVFGGSVCSFAYSNSKEPLSQALADIKGDIITGLQSRLDVLWDESDGESGLAVDHGKEGSDELSTEAPFLQLNLHSLSYGGFIRRRLGHHLVFGGGFMLRLEVRDNGRVWFVLISKLRGYCGWGDISRKYWAFCGWKRAGGLTDSRSFLKFANIDGWPDNTVVVKDRERRRRVCDVEVMVESTKRIMRVLGRCLVGKMEIGALMLLSALEVHRWAQRTWKVMAGIQVSDLGGDSFLFAFPSVEEAHRVLKGTWSFGGRKLETGVGLVVAEDGAVFHFLEECLSLGWLVHISVTIYKQLRHSSSSDCLDHLKVVKDHCIELMSMDAPTDPSTILELETESLALTTESFWDVAAPFSLTSSQDCSSSQKTGVATSQENESKSVKPTDFNFMAAILILILSILVGLVLYTFNAF
ncbi:hypothetical protein RHMOL_Rhmol07G0277600 [Rhododendron molle]|uniref:Uncharacterized protein n=1 Tax=Rhododendron molle TaxID=49168 RepID=A0ACC0N6Y3_RHOML|nr:hypothetical protein RHMOL_Rhmol07G0277600 [Rhododendron molle]